VSVPTEGPIKVTLEHDRKAFGVIKGREKGDEPQAGVTPGVTTTSED